jgi:hypothetical protein
MRIGDILLPVEVLARIEHMERDPSIIRAAHELTLKFINETDIPNRFKKKTGDKKSKYDPNSSLELNFQAEVSGWTTTIESILYNSKSDEQAWRFIRINPETESELTTVTKCQDFLDFMVILIQRRDKDNCPSDELGKLCMLHGAFQKQVEQIISS